MTTTLPTRVNIVEVGPRDGLQNESDPIATAVKRAFINALTKTGLTSIEATSFVHPRAVPQLADAEEVAAGLPTLGDVTFSALVPNERGLERALDAGMKRIAVFTAASDAFAQRNIRMTITESLDVFGPVVEAALAAGLSVRGYVSTAFVCPYAGEIDPGRVVEVTGELLAMGVDEVAISDTIGAAAPNDITRTIGAVLETGVVPEYLALHLHDTYGTALANVYAGLLLGIATFDGAAGGLGGCPYAPGAAGNLPTEDLVYFLDRLGIKTGVDLLEVVKATRIIAPHVGHALASKQCRRLASWSGS